MFGMNIIKSLKTSYEIVLSNDNRLLCHTMGGKTVIFDTKNWEKVMELSKPSNPNHLHFSKDDKLLYIKNTVGTTCVYDTEDFRLLTSFKSKTPFKTQEGDFAVLNEPFTVIDVLKINNIKQICTVNFETGNVKILTEFDLNCKNIKFNKYTSQDNSYLFTLTCLNRGTGHLLNQIVKVTSPLSETSITVESPKELYNWDLVYFDTKHRVYIFFLEPYKIIIMDEALKKIIRHDFLTDKGIKRDEEYFVHINVSSDGNYIVLTSSKRVIILGFEDLTPILIEEIQDACFAAFSKNDAYFLVGSWSKGYIFENNLPKTNGD